MATNYTITHPVGSFTGVLTVRGFTMNFVNGTYTGPATAALATELAKIGYTAVAQAAQDAPTILGGTGVPAAATGSDGAFYFRLDGTAGAAIYQRRSGAWVAVA